MSIMPSSWLGEWPSPERPNIDWVEFGLGLSEAIRSKVDNEILAILKES